MMLSILTALSTTGNSLPLHFGRDPLNECYQVPIVCELCDPFAATTLQSTEDHTFSVRIGPSGSDRGYMALTGKATAGTSVVGTGMARVDRETTKYS